MASDPDAAGTRRSTASRVDANAFGVRALTAIRAGRSGVDLTGWAVLCARVILGLIFGMAGYWKTFVLTPAGHYHRFFEPYVGTWIPVWMLWAAGVTIPVVEFVAGWLLVIGLWTAPSLVALGVVLMTVTYGHLLKDPLYSFTGHVIPRFALLAFVALLAGRDVYSLDALVRSKPRTIAGFDRRRPT